MTFHGHVHDQEMLLARQVRAADDPRTSSAGPPSAPDLNWKAAEHGVAAIWQDARESLDYSVRTYYTKAGITYLQRTTALPDGVRVRGPHCVTIGEAGQIRATFCRVEMGAEEDGDDSCGRGARRSRAPGKEVKTRSVDLTSGPGVRCLPYLYSLLSPQRLSFSHLFLHRTLCHAASVPDLTTKTRSSRSMT